MKPKPRYQPGDKIGGRYEVHQALMGGMGEVYLCLDLERNYPYALKTFQQRYLANPRLRKAFEDEVATWVALEKHPNIVRCFYMDVLDNQPFIALAWIAGEEGRGADLRGWLRRGPLDLRLALDFTIDICRGLTHAQEKQPGIVHRDLKPENILVAQGRLAKITDWGLAKIVQDTGLKTSDPEAHLDRNPRRSNQGGTYQYMAPEQWLGDELDQRTDIYAVGCILYELITGHWPFFEANTVSELRRCHLQAAIRLQRKQDEAAILSEVLACCLAKRREERFANVRELLAQVTFIYQQQFAELPKAIPTGDKFIALDYAYRGLTYHKLQRYEEALTDYDRAIQLNPNHAQAYNNRGVTYYDLRRYEEALTDYTRAIQLDPNYAAAHDNRGNVYDALERYEEALTDYDQAIQLDPNNAPAYNNRGVTYWKLQQYEEALADLSRAIQLDLDYAAAYANRGVTNLKLQQYEDALTDLSRAIQLDSTLSHAYDCRGAIYHELQRYEEALADFDQLVQLEPHSAMAHTNRGALYADLQRYEDALTDHSRAIQFDPTLVAAYTNRGKTYAALQRCEEALADFAQVTVFDPENAEAYLGMGISLAMSGEYREALNYGEKAVQLGSSRAVEFIAAVRQKLATASASQANRAQQAFEMFQSANSASDMQQTVAEFSFMTDSSFIQAAEQAIAQQVPPEHQTAFKQRLAWLRQIASEQKE